MEALKKIFPFILLPGEQRKDILVDASVMQIQDIIARIEAKIKDGYTFVITTTNRQELEKLTKHIKDDLSSENARKYLELQKSYPNNFSSVADLWTFSNPDLRILQFIKRHNVELWTSDTELAINANSFDSKVEFWDPKVYNKTMTKIKGKGTFWQARLEGGSLILDNNQKDRLVWVVRNDRLYTNPKNGFEFMIGDEVIVAIKKYNPKVNLYYIAFAAYTIVAIANNNNVTINYTHQFYDKREPKTELQNQLYKTAVLSYIEKYFSDIPDELKKPTELKKFTCTN